MNQDRLETLLKLEGQRRMNAAHEIRRAATAREVEILRQVSARGGGSFSAEAKLTLEHESATVRDMAEAWVKIRRELVRSEPELSTAEQIGLLRQKLVESIQAWTATRRGEFSRRGRAAGYDLSAWDRQIDLEGARVHDFVVGQLREIELEGKAGLVASGSPSPVSLTIGNMQNSQIGAVNVLAIAGNIGSVTATIEKSGQVDLGRAIRRISDAVVASVELTETDRAAALDALQTLAAQVATPVETRQPSLRVLFSGLARVLGMAADVVQVWTVYGPAIARHFGWPVA